MCSSPQPQVIVPRQWNSSTSTAWGSNVNLRIGIYVDIRWLIPPWYYPWLGLYYFYIRVHMLYSNPLSQDEQVHFGHPIIVSICKSFYFYQWSDISAFDRDTFRGSVPKPLVALVGTIVRYFILSLSDSFLMWVNSIAMRWMSGQMELHLQSSLRVSIIPRSTMLSLIA